MRFESGGRQSGKTVRMLDWLRRGDDLDERRVILTFSSQEAGRLYSLLDEKYHDQILTPHELPRLKGRRSTVVAIDNVDRVLQQMVPAPIDYVTYTGPPYTGHSSSYGAL